MPMRQHAALIKGNNDKSIRWIEVVFGRALFEMAVAGRSWCATIEHLKTITPLLSVN